MERTGRHIAIVAPPLAGHYDPLRVLARRLIDLGHRVTFFHLAEAATLAGEGGIGFAPVDPPDLPGTSLRSYLHRLGRADTPAGLAAMIRHTAALTSTLLDGLPAALSRAGIDAVIADATEPAGGLVARHLGLPFVTSFTGLPLLGEVGVPPPFIGWSYRPDRLGMVRNALGYRIVGRMMRPIARVVADRAKAWRLDPGEDDGGSPLLQIAQCPAAFDFPRRALPDSFRYCGPFRIEDDAPVDLPADGRPLVYCSLGSLQGARPAMFAAMTRACADVGARAVVAHGGGLSADEERSLPGDPLVGAFWPQGAVLRRCGAALVHGGFNTVLDALAAGVPMVVMPIAFEQPATAARLAYHGAGTVVTRRRLDQRRLRTALAGMLADGPHRDAVRRQSTAIDASAGAAGAAALIDTVIAGRAPPPLPPPGAPTATATTGRPAEGDARGGSRRNGSR